ncbi:MAG TPA: hypothetical protein VJ965_02855 [Anaerolineales bacterium]|nr:hypothetical protein [Anaerolineales bacterium]
MSKQKILSQIILLLVLILLLAACVRPITTAESPTPRGTDLLDEILTSTVIPVGDDDDATPEGMLETIVVETLSAELAQTQEATPEPSMEETSLPEATATLHIITPTSTGEPTAETTPEETQEADETPAPTNTTAPQPTIDAVQINPDAEFTGAHHVDTMDEPSLWWDESGILPDSQYIKLEQMDGQMNVTGKLNLWDTWWISGFNLNNFYIEMEVNSGSCIDSDVYGMILRASQHGQPTRGYLIGFTCDGKVLAKRLESVSPYVAISILNPTETNLINAGPNQTNIIGIAFDGNTITIYPNRYYFTTIQDTTFSYGRFGIFVQAGDDGNYTFSVDEIRTWGIISD